MCCSTCAKRFQRGVFNVRGVDNVRKTGASARGSSGGRPQRSGEQIYRSVGAPHQGRVEVFSGGKNREMREIKSKSLGRYCIFDSILRI